MRSLDLKRSNAPRRQPRTSAFVASMTGAITFSFLPSTEYSPGKGKYDLPISSGSQHSCTL